MNPIPILVLAAVLALIMVRRIGGIVLPIWLIMSSGAVLLLITFQIAPGPALRSIDLDVILFLLGVFVLGEALDRSGYLRELASWGFSRATTPALLLVCVACVSGVLSAILMNDTIAVVGTPLVIHLARRSSLSAKPLLLTLAFSITIGSVLSPIGNPQNLLIALDGGLAQPFPTFIRYLLVPTVLNMAVMVCIVLIFFRNDLNKRRLDLPRGPSGDPVLRRIARSSLILFVSLIGLRIAAQLLGLPFIGLTPIALIGALPILVLSRRRLEIARGIDWRTLAFFVSMFIVMAAVWGTGFFQDLTASMDLTDVPTVIASSVLISQLISNVPFVALFLKIVVASGGGASPMMALAAGSTIAGNLTVLGAASNIIIIQGAERNGHTIGYLEFLKVGLPLTIANSLIYILFLA